MNEKDSIYDLIYRAQRSDKRSMEQLIDKFQPTLCKYAALLRTEDAKSDLTLFMIEMILKLKLTDFEDDYRDIKLAVYLSRAVKNRYIGLLREKDDTKYPPLPFSEAITFSEKDVYSDVHFFMLLNPLTDNQKRIMVMVYYYGFSIADTARLLKVSRQAVTKDKRKALNRLRASIDT